MFEALCNLTGNQPISTQLQGLQGQSTQFPEGPYDSLCQCQRCPFNYSPAERALFTLHRQTQWHILPCLTPIPKHHKQICNTFLQFWIQGQVKLCFASSKTRTDTYVSGVFWFYVTGCLVDWWIRSTIFHWGFSFSTVLRSFTTYASPLCPSGGPKRWRREGWYGAQQAQQSDVRSMSFC